MNFEQEKYRYNTWRERLAGYSQTDEFKKLYAEHREELVVPENKLTTPLVVSFVGIPGSGKSTVAGLLQEFVPAVHLRSDVIEQAELPNPEEIQKHDIFFRTLDMTMPVGAIHTMMLRDLELQRLLTNKTAGKD